MNIRPTRVTLAAVMALAPVAATLPAEPAQAALPTAPVVSNGTRSGALAAYNNYLRAAVAVPSGWNGSTASCTPGSTTAAHQNATLTAINYYRSMVGLRPVTFNSSWSAKAQKAALVMQANGALNHNPPSSWRCWSSTAATSAAASNLYLTSGTHNGPMAVNAYIDDIGNDAAMAHRRWILDPSLLVMGNGQTARANALQLWEGRPSRTNPTGTPAWVSWPDAGYVPKALVPRNNVWSLSASDPAVDLSAATITATSNGVKVPVTVTRLTAGYGRPAIGYKPQFTASTVSIDKTVTFTLRGAKKNGVLLPSRTWSTTVFDQTKSRSPQAISWSAPATAYQGQVLTMAARASSGKAITYSTSTPVNCSVSGNKVTLLAEGVCSVTARQAGDTGTWAPVSSKRTVQVWLSSKKANTITFAQPAAASSGTSRSLGATASSGLAVTYSSVTPTVCTVSGSTVTHVAGGTCTIVARQPGSSTVNTAVAVTRSWAVSGLKANTITWNPPTSVTVGQQVARNATSTSGSSMFLWSASMTTAGACSFNGGYITFGAKGSCTVTVSQAATSTYQAARVTRTFTVS